MSLRNMEERSVVAHAGSDLRASFVDHQCDIH